MMKQAFRARYFLMWLWVIVPIAVFLFYQISGLPHVIWSYRFHDNGDRYNPFAERYYTDCTFIGPYGEFTRYATNGNCEWFRFFKEQGQ